MTGAADDAGKLDRITESVAAKFAVRILLPLVTLICIPLFVAQWTALRNDIASGNAKTEATSERLATLERDVTTINTKLDAGLIWRLSQLERRFEAMESRVERREAQRPGP